MIKYLARPVLELASRWLDDTVDAARLQAFLVDRLKRLHDAAPTRGGSEGAEEIAADLAITWIVAGRAGLVSPPLPTDQSPEKRAPSGDEIQRWIDSVPKGKVVTAKRLVAGSGRWLDSIGAADDRHPRPFLLTSIESLLRNVEVRRRRALEPVDPQADGEQSWLEKHDVAILLARHSRRTADLRMLNATFKLNDWAFSKHRRLGGGRTLARYLFALAEQELAARELLS